MVSGATRQLRPRARGSGGKSTAIDTSQGIMFAPREIARARLVLAVRTSAAQLADLEPPSVQVLALDCHRSSHLAGIKCTKRRTLRCWAAEHCDICQNRLKRWFASLKPIGNSKQFRADIPGSICPAVGLWLSESHWLSWGISFIPCARANTPSAMRTAWESLTT